ncbi:MAG: hypothetical protein IKX40_00475 [Thermoguttaceae bacterium]|nr:hypothetical protein [Thermoguttaceae bacterium]
MNKYIVLSAAALVISLTVGCQNCGYKTAHCSRYQTLVGTTRLASPQTNCRYNACGVSNACNTCNTCNTCDTQMLANNSPLYSNAYAQDASQNGWYQSYAAENASSSASLLDGTQQTAQSEAPLRWRRVTEEEQQYANSAVNPTSAGVTSALSAPAFGSPAPASALGPNTSRRATRGVASALETPDYPAPNAASQYPGQYPRQYPGQYPGQYPNSSPRAARGVASALDTPGYPEQAAAPQYPGQYAGQYPNTSPRATRGVDSALSVPNHPLPPQYAGQYPNSPRVASGVNPSYNNPSYGAPTSGTGEEPLRWRHATEEEQQYYNSPHRASAPMNGTDNSAYSADQSLTVPVYSGNNADASQTQGNLTMPEIDPNALPSLNPESGTF